MAGSTIISLRVRPGEDASRLNLYRPRQPRLLGLSAALTNRDGFAWADVPRDAANPWRLLDEPSADAVPVILEKNTANYSLNLWGGLGETFEVADGRGRPLRLKIVALLADSIFQGDLLISEGEFLGAVPRDERLPVLSRRLPGRADCGCAECAGTEPGRLRLCRPDHGRAAGRFSGRAEHVSVDLSKPSAGWVLLGTLGLAVVQFRSVFERRGELWLVARRVFAAAGCAGLVLLEHALLLVAGLGIGVLAALLAVLPQRGPHHVLAVGIAGRHAVGRAGPAWPQAAWPFAPCCRAPLLLSLRQENLDRGPYALDPCRL